MNELEIKNLIDRFVIGYNKGQVLNTINENTTKIIRSNMDEISESLDDVLAAVEEISSSAESTASRSSKIEQSMDSLINRNIEINSKLEKSSDALSDTASKAKGVQQDFSDLEKRSFNIQGMSSEIQNVAEETNVLAINASIEAARAGEAGKGFRIISGEVRKLANKTYGFADQITGEITEFSTILKSMSSNMTQFMSNVNQFSSALDEVQSVFSTNSETADQTVSEVSHILKSIQEQSEALTLGMNSLIAVNERVKDSNTVMDTLGKCHNALDSLLQNKA